MTCVIKHFSDLDTTELYELLKLRSAVFVVEQNCVYQDCDDKDQSSFHLLVYDQDELIASARCLPPGISYEEYCSIGRVVSMLWNVLLLSVKRNLKAMILRFQLNLI